MTRVHFGVALLVGGLFACGKPPDACDGVTWSPPSGCDASASIDARLACVPGLTFTQVLDGSAPAGYSRFALELTQQVDAHEASAGTFKQRAVLDYIGDDAPTVLFTSGYDLYAGPAELTTAYAANQLSYEHRYFADSTPSPTDWSKLTVENAAADAHHLVESLRWALPGKWLNTGGSKGGVTSVLHRRFHPCDVDGTVAYVAPITKEVEDPAYPDFIDRNGGDPWASCRNSIVAFQRRLLNWRAVVVPQLQGSFTYLGADRAFEMAVVEFPFPFWQYGSPLNENFGCAAIPDEQTPMESHVDFLLAFSDPDELAGDDSLSFYAAYYYQSASQLGGPAPFEKHLSDLLHYPGANATPTFLSVPNVPTPTFSVDAMNDFSAWAQKDAERVLLIYGELDPWSAHPILVDGANDSKMYMQAGGNHGSRIGRLSGEQRDDVLKTVSRWLGGRQVVNEPRSLRPPEPERRFPR